MIQSTLKLSSILLSTITITNLAFGAQSSPDEKKPSQTETTKAATTDQNSPEIVRVHTKKTLIERSNPNSNQDDFKINFVSNEDVFDLVEIPRDWLNSRHFRFPVKLRLKEKLKVIGAKDIVLNSTPEKPDEYKVEFDYNFEITQRLQCVPLTTVDEMKSKTNYDLCIEIVEEDLTKLGVNNDSFFYRRPKGYWFQGGLGHVFQTLPPATANGVGGDSQQGVVRMGAGMWYKSYILETYYRTKVYTENATDYAPRWIQGIAGYSWELPKFWSITPHLTLYAGVEKYDNLSNANNIRYIQSGFGPIYGFRTRFSFGSRLEIGGDAFFTVGQMQKFFIQGDTRYWLTNNWSLGAGYWIDSAKDTSADSNFSEKNVALEGYVRYTY